MKSSVLIFPFTAPLTASDTSRQYVGLYLKVKVHKQNYPDNEIPKEVDVFQVRGLDELKVEELLVLLKQRCDDSVGIQVLFSLIDDCKEFLTNHNFPTCPCSICLFHIVEEDAFVKTTCYHYFHSTCFGRYLKNFQPISGKINSSTDRYSNNLKAWFHPESGA